MRKWCWFFFLLFGLVFLVGSSDAARRQPRVSVFDDSATFVDDYNAIVQNAKTFIQSLSPQQKKAALFPFSSKNRITGFCFVPALTCENYNPGLLYRELNSQQRIYLQRFLASTLSEQGYHKILTAMLDQNFLSDYIKLYKTPGLNYVLPHGSTWEIPNYKYYNYFIRFYGVPNKTPWGFRFEGHHISINFTFVRDKHGVIMVNPFPTFYGADPHVVPPEVAKFSDPVWGQHVGQVYLGHEITYAKEFIASLPPKIQRSGFSFAKDGNLNQGMVPNDIYSLMDRVMKRVNDPDFSHSKIRWKNLSPKSKRLLVRYFKLYLDNHLNSFVAPIWPKVKKSLPSAVVVWEGSLKRYQPFYMAVKTNDYIIEVLQEQAFTLNIDRIPANHVHTIIRSIKNDWDYDYLRQHLNQDPHDQEEQNH